MPAAVAARLHAELEQRHGQEANRHLLAGRGDHIELARVRVRLDLPGERDQAVGLARHRGGHDDEVMARLAPLGDPARDVLDPLDRADRRAAELLYDKRHG